MQPRLGTLDLLLVRHAEAAPPDAAGDPEDQRPLSEAGRRAAEELADELEPFHVSAVYSSPYPRAVQTVEPTARRRGLPIQELADMRERRLSSAAVEDWRSELARSFDDPDYAMAGGETGRAAQRRAMAILDLLRVRHPDGGRVIVASHGNLIALILQALEPAVGFDFHQAMPNPAIYHLEHDGIGWRVMGGHGFAPAAAQN
jgi:2,3-bisphosphoglycerate-dependent phosphoglycerate mutase